MSARRVRLWSVGIIGFLAAAIVLLVLPLRAPLDLTRTPVPPGRDSVVVIAGARYGAGAFQRFFLGDRWRVLWTEPITVPVLQLREVDGGLVTVREGGGLETRSLHFLSHSGRHFVFRSTDKELVRLLSYGLSRSLLARLVQDVTSASHPAGVLVAAPLQAALGLPAGHPRLVVLPPDPLLGPYLPRFAGLLGTFQEGPGESPPDSAAPVGGHLPEIEETASVLALVDGVATHRVDARSFLTARLLDLLLNDWDRHARQWRWAGRADSTGVVWQPIPVDRDQVFSRYDGLLMAIARLRTSKLSVFGPEYPPLQGLLHNSIALDRRLLAGLSRASWDSIAGFVAARLTDSVLEAAVRRMPEPYWRLSGPGLAANLQQRRSGLGELATRFYLELARQPEVHLAPGETATLSFQPDRSVELRISSGPADAAGGRMVRRFQPGETAGIDIHLPAAPGSARVVRTGRETGPILVRVFDALGRTLPQDALR